jgi:hypothetical protein
MRISREQVNSSLKLIKINLIDIVDITDNIKGRYLCSVIFQLYLCINYILFECLKSKKRRNT